MLTNIVVFLLIVPIIIMLWVFAIDMLRDL